MKITENHGAIFESFPERNKNVQQKKQQKLRYKLLLRFSLFRKYFSVEKKKQIKINKIEKRDFFKDAGRIFL